MESTKPYFTLEVRIRGLSSLLSLVVVKKADPSKMYLGRILRWLPNSPFLT